MKKYRKIFTPLNGRELLDLVDNKANLIIYRQILELNNIFDILGEYGASFILYETKLRRGHWTLLFEREPDKIEFFDPYGLLIDDEFNFIPEEFIEETGMFPKLRELIYYSPYTKIEYNDHALQDIETSDIATCGRWCALRLMFRDLDIDHFNHMIMLYTRKHKITPDEAVVKLTTG